MNGQKKIALAARYRPQTFEDVAGQEMVKAVLSRACLEDRPACAYLFSGTRGVGKTTIARIFAKALNCEHAPCAEPCNSCVQCTRVMQGKHVDVVEIDGASNNKVEDVRSLRETVNYAPMEGRYKVFIIDEAHMLTVSAFNALLKTLEEPPPHVVFVMATTEAHKFPITIVSRCQHFTFRHLNEGEIVAHLEKILHKEQLTYDEEAVRLIAKRAQGSVRDGMSLLDQTLAFGEQSLSVTTARKVLGLVGQEFFEQFFDAVISGDCPAVVRLTQTILQQGVDIGFFIRELTGYLRSFFLLAQVGPSILPALALSPGEETMLKSRVQSLSLVHLHAAWQLVLDAQKSVVQSTEPSSALELLLLNVTLLPQLMPLESLGRTSPRTAPSQSAPLPPKAPAPLVLSKPNQNSAAQQTQVAYQGTPREPAAAPLQRTDASLAEPVRAAAKPSQNSAAQQTQVVAHQRTPREPAAAPLQRTDASLAEPVRASAKPSQNSAAQQTQVVAHQVTPKEPSEAPVEGKDASFADHVRVSSSNQESLDLSQKPKDVLQEDPQARENAVSTPPKDPQSADASLPTSKVQTADAQVEQRKVHTPQEEERREVRPFSWPDVVAVYVERAEKRGENHLAARELLAIPATFTTSFVELKPQHAYLAERLTQIQGDLELCLQQQYAQPGYRVQIVPPKPKKSSEELLALVQDKEELKVCMKVFDCEVEEVDTTGQLRPRRALYA